MITKKLFQIIFCCIVIGTIISCSNENKKQKSEKLSIVCTTTMITDAVTQIVGDKADVNGLMGPGVDPHLYKASEGDVQLFFNADVIFYNGLHLEGKLEDVLKKMHDKGSHIYAVSSGVDSLQLIASELFASNFDPHIWFDIQLWKQGVKFIAKKLIEADTANATFYTTNVEKYCTQLDSLASEVKASIDSLPKENRILITAHDAFNYFGKAHNFEVMGLQGISTASEPGVKNVQELANVIVEKKVKAVFVESSVSEKNINALIESVKSKGFNVSLGGSLYSDATGSAGTDAHTYIGMYRSNVQTIVNALK